MIGVAPCWKAGRIQYCRTRSRRLDGTAETLSGSIELGIFDESERVRARGSQAHARRSWPLSARLLVGALFVLNILLAAFFVKTEIERPGAPAILHSPKAGSTPKLNATPDQGSSRGLTSPATEARPVASPNQMAKRAPIKRLPKALGAGLGAGLRASKPSRAALPAPMPRTVIYPPHESVVRTPAPVRNPAASSSASANISRPGRAPSFGIPSAGVPSSAGTHPNAPAASALNPATIGHGLTSKGTRSGAVATVASVRLPAMEKELVTPHRHVAPAGVKVEIIPRPPVKLENCGDDKVFIACPTLKIRYDTPYTSEAP
jgi:hypothetical protein